jgi:hypothetical protein
MQFIRHLKHEFTIIEHDDFYFQFYEVTNVFELVFRYLTTRKRKIIDGMIRGGQS